MKANEEEPMLIGDVIKQLASRPLVINNTANIIAINRLRKQDYKRFKKFQELWKQSQAHSLR